MARTRLELNALLTSLDESYKVYFQPPENISMAHPAIVYHRDPSFVQYADNLPYQDAKCYRIQVIARDPDSTILEKLEALPYCRHTAFYTADNLNHDVYTIYY